MGSEVAVAKLPKPTTFLGQLHEQAMNAIGAFKAEPEKLEDEFVADAPMKKPLSPNLEKNKYHDALIDKIADIAIEYSAPMDVIVELHPDPKASGYVVRMYRDGAQDKGTSFRVTIQDCVQLNVPLLESEVQISLGVLTPGQTYTQKKYPILGMPAPTIVPAVPRGQVFEPQAHPAACVCKACKKNPKPQARHMSEEESKVPDVPLARRPIDPTKVIDLGDRVMDLE